MDRMSELTTELGRVLEQLRAEAASRDERSLLAPLDWLDEAAYWLSVEVKRTREKRPDGVPFTYIPAPFRK